MNTVIDMMGRKITIPKKPMRIVSLVPSQTELLFDLGLGDRVVGITKFCIHPKEWFRSKVRVGGTKQINLDKVIALSPDLIIGNKEENTKEDIAALEQHFPVWMSDIFNLQDAVKAINLIGSITNTASEAKQIGEQIIHSFAALNGLKTHNRCAYLIWHDPDMVAANNTFIDNMISKLGLLNAFEDRDRYPVITDQDLVAAAIDYLLLSSEPFPFSEKHILHYQQLLPNVKILLVDGEYFSWYGSRLLGAPQYFNQLLKEL